MPDIINSSFDPRLPFPLDVRQQKNDLNALYAIPNTSRWEGMVVYVKGAGIPYILKGGIDNSFWTPFQFNGGGGILPNGIVVYGESQQSGNDILLNDAWVWRIDQVDYQSSDDVIAITPAASGNLRVDIIVGNNLGEFVKVVGTEVASPGPAIEPNIPADTVPLLRVDVNDTGIASFEEFALSAFVRFDIDNQGLLPSQQDNALKNINGVRKVGDDTRTGGLTNNGKVTIDLDEASSSLPILELYQQGVLKHLFSGEQARILPKLLRVNSPVSPTDEGAAFRGGTNGGDPIFEIQNAAGTKIFYPRGTGGIGQLRSTLSDESIRRDENYLTYPVTISGTGKLNDVALANGVGAIKFSSGVTEVSGIDPSGDGKELFIWSDNPDGITLPAQDTDSIAANRYLREVTVPYQTWVKTVYDTDLSRWVNANTGELQETDARYFEVTDDVLTLKYILPDIEALQAFVRGPAVIAEVSDPLRGGKFNYVTEGDFSGSADFGISFPAQDGGYWVRGFDGPVVSSWYGTKGNKTDDTTALQAACTACKDNGGKLFIPKGDYRTTTEITVPQNVHVFGAGSYLTRFFPVWDPKTQNGYTNCVFTAENLGTTYKENITISDIWVDGTDDGDISTPKRPFESQYVNNLTLRNIIVKNCWGVKLRFGNNWTVENFTRMPSTFALDGHVSAISAINITGARFLNTRGEDYVEVIDLGFCNDIEIDGVYCKAAEYGVLTTEEQEAIDLGASYDIFISNVEVIGFYDGINVKTEGGNGTYRVVMNNIIVKDFAQSTGGSGIRFYVGNAANELPGSGPSISDIKINNFIIESENVCFGINIQSVNTPYWLKNVSLSNGLIKVPNGSRAITGRPGENIRFSNVDFEGEAIGLGRAFLNLVSTTNEDVCKNIVFDNCNVITYGDNGEASPIVLKIDNVKNITFKTCSFSCEDTTAHIVVPEDCENISFVNKCSFTVDDTRALTTPGGVKNITIDDCDFYARTERLKYCMYFAVANGISITNNRFHPANDGTLDTDYLIQMYGTYSYSVEGNNFDGCYGLINDFANENSFYEKIPFLDIENISLSSGNPVEITITAHPYETGQRVRFADVGGTVELNGNIYTLTDTGANTFTLDGTDGDDFTAYSSGGTSEFMTQKIHDAKVVGNKCKKGLALPILFNNQYNVDPGEETFLCGIQVNDNHVSYNPGVTDYGVSFQGASGDRLWDAIIITGNISSGLGIGFASTTPVGTNIVNDDNVNY